MASQKIPVKELGQSALENEIIRVVEKALNERLVDLAVDDIKLIAKEIMPDLDAMVSRKVKQHLHEIGLFMVHKFDIGE